MLKPSIFVGGQTKDSRSFLYLAMYLIAVFSFLVAITASVYNGAQDRERVRYEHIQSNGFNVLTIPAAYGDYQVFGFAIEAEDENKQQPPIGIANWIEPGEVAVSPRLATLFPIGTISPWGQVVQLIDEGTLSTPTEYFFYTRIKPSNSAQKSATVNKFSGFAAGDSYSFRYWGIFASAFVGIILFPAFLIVILGSRSLRYNSAQYRSFCELYQGFTPRLYFCIGLLKKPATFGILLLMVLTTVCLMPHLQVPYVGIRFNARDVLNATIWAVGLFIVLTSIVILCLALRKPSESIKLSNIRAIGVKRQTPLRELFNFIVAVASICLFIFPDLPTVFLDPALILAVIGYGMLAALISIQLMQLIYGALAKVYMSCSLLVASRKVAALTGTLTKVFTFILIVGMGISVFQLRGQAVDAFTDYGAQKAQKMQNKVLQIRELIPEDRLDASITELINPAVGELYCIGISVRDNREQLLLYTTELREEAVHGEKPALIQEVLSEIGEGITNATKTQVFSSDNVIVFLVNEQGIDSTKLGAELLPEGLRVSELGRDYLVMVEMQKYFGYWHLLLGIVGVFPLLFGLLLPVTALIARSLGILELKEQLYYPKRFRLAVGTLVGIVPFLTIPCFICVGYVVFGSIFQRRILTYPPLDNTVPLWVSVACVGVLLVCFLQIYWQPQPPQPQSPSAEASGKEVGSS